MIDSKLRAAFERKWEFTGVDEDIAHELYAADAILEFPQSGERFDGVESFKVWRSIYPGNVEINVRRLDRWGDLVVGETFVKYDDTPAKFGVSLIELNQNDEIVRERIYIMDGWDAPDWRLPYRSPLPADTSLGDTD